MYLSFFKLLKEGGPLFMYTNLIVLLAIIVFLVKAFLKLEKSEKAISLVKHLSLFALVWGFLGQVIGLIGAFDAIQVATDIPPQVLAAGLKVSSLSPAFGMLIFIIARVGLIVFTLLNRDKVE